MKDLIKLSLYLFSFTFLLVSCGGETSTKGNWTSSDLEKCKSDIISEMQNDPASEEILSLSGKTMDEFATCVCDNVSEAFDSYSIADEDESMTEEEAGMMFLSCFGEESLIDLGIEMEEGEETEPETTSTETNISYTCPLCDGITHINCKDCSNTNLVWCHASYDDIINQIRCLKCEWSTYASWGSCSHCNKSMRDNDKFWSNQTGATGCE
jgi:hypothetical protein